MGTRSTSSNRPKAGGDRVAWAGSALIHGLAFALLAWVSAVEPPPMEFQTFEMEIVSAPATAPQPVQDPAPPEEELVVEEPDPTPPEPEDPPPVVDDEPPPREVETPPPDPEPTPPDPDPIEEAAADSAETEVTGEEIRVRLEGLQRFYPQYYENIIRQIGNCFRWRGSDNLEAQLYFVIDRDGTVSDDRVVQESGNIRFDLQAIEAVVDCAGRGRFGPLPEDLPYDRLPVLFTFHPPRR